MKQRKHILRKIVQKISLPLATYFRSIDKQFTDSHIRNICLDYFISQYILSEYS